MCDYDNSLNQAGKGQIAPDISIDGYATGATPSLKSHRPTLAQEHEKAAFDHREQANRKEQAAAFFKENPAFDEFIRLIRSGVIGI